MRLMYPAILAGGMFTAWMAQAVMFKSTSDPIYNKTAPAGALVGSGWQWEGSWGNFLGTPIAPTFFIAAKHVNSGDTNWTFVLNGFTYHPVAFANCPNADLTVWRVAETFPSYASLCAASNEVGQACVVFGCGTRRGTEVIVDNATNGWRWGASDGVKRWGENNVASVENGGTGYGQLLYCTFDRGAGSNECHLSVGDSSGGMFIQDGGVWKLAGIHYAVDGYFSTNGTSNTQFNGALLDMGGLWVGEGTNWTYVTKEPTDIPSGFYSTRISANLNWIKKVINFEPGPDLRIVGIQLVGASVSISLATGSNRLYRIERTTDLLAGQWDVVTNNVAGTGGTVTVTDPVGASLSNAFYRAALEQ